jgi:protein AroM
MFGPEPPDTIIQHGALDDLPRPAIDDLAPRDDEHPLVTRLRDGSEVTLAKERLTPRMQRAIDRAIADGATMLVVLCTGQFKGLESSVPVVYPDHVLGHTIEAILPHGTIGVMMPHLGQESSMRQKYGNPSRAFIGVAVSPYAEALALEDQARFLAESGADLIMMDCMGFTGEMKRTVVRAASVPTILANRLVGRIVEELITS